LGIRNREYVIGCLLSAIYKKAAPAAFSFVVYFTV
jgi:hypothetical protein